MPKNQESLSGFNQIQGIFMQARLLLSTQRSGSHFLKSFIEARFPNVACTGEVLEQPFDKQHPVLPSNPEISRFWPWYIKEAAAKSISAAPDKRISAFEFYLTKLIWLAEPRDLVIDVKYSSIRTLSGYWDSDHGSCDFTTFIRMKEIPVLHLIRRNILKMIVSDKLARETGNWHLTPNKPDPVSLPKIRLEPKKVLRLIIDSDRLTQDYQERFSDYPHYEEVVYEDFVREQKQSEPGNGLKTLTRFLGKTPHESNQSRIGFRKTTPNDPSEVVENWDEMVHFLTATDYAWMAQSPLLVAA
jgi:LPS sulfotransferase NodH